MNFAVLFGHRLFLYDKALSPNPIQLGKADRNWCIAWSPDGSCLAAGGYDGLAVWHVASQKQLFHQRCGAVRHHGLAWSPDGRLVAAGNSDGIISWFRASDGKRELTVNAHTALVMGLEWNKSGSRVASVKMVLKIWDAATGAHLVTLSCEAYVSRYEVEPKR